MFGLFIATLAIAGGFIVRSRLRSARQSEDGLCDGDIRRIEMGLPLEREEPLDRDGIRRAEEEFWSETWDEPEEPFM